MGKTVEIRIPEEVISRNAKEFDEEISRILEENCEAENVVFDADITKYCSSAALRVLLKVRKQYENVSIINCSLDLYNILEETGFVNMMPVKKKMKFVSSEGLKPVGHGANSQVWKLGDDMILKTYSVSVDLDTIETEKKISRYLFSLDFPTCIPFEVVRSEPGYAIMYESMNDGSVAEIVDSGKGSLKKYAVEFGELFNSIHAIEDKMNYLQYSNDLYHSFIDKSDEFFEESETEFLHRLVDAIPRKETIVHGDYHPKNIMRSGSELFAIDVGEVAKGHPVFDYISTYCDLVLQIRMSPKMAAYMGMDADSLFEFWDCLEPVIIRGNDTERSEAVQLLEKLGCLQLVHLISWKIPGEAAAEGRRMAVDMTRKLLLSADLNKLIDDFNRLEHCFI